MYRKGAAGDSWDVSKCAKLFSGCIVTRVTRQSWLLSCRAAYQSGACLLPLPVDCSA